MAKYYVLNELQEHNFDVSCCVGCGFDGAAAMASERVGAAAAVKVQAPLADYFHCTMHSLNLTASQSLKSQKLGYCFDCIHETV